MSDTDSFIEEVSEEVRRDRLYALLRKYGWLAALIVVLIVGGAAFSEYRKAQAQAAAEGLGDRILAAMAEDTASLRLAGLEEIDVADAGADVVVTMLAAGEAQQSGDAAAAVALLDTIAVNGDVPDIYRDIAAFKSLVLQADVMESADRRQQLAALATPGAPLSLLAQEQLGLMDIAEGRTASAIDRFQSIIEDAGVSNDLQQRGLQVIVALGGTPELSNLPELAN